MEKAVKRFELISQNMVFQSHVSGFRPGERDDFPYLFARGAEFCEAIFAFYLEEKGFRTDKNLIYYEKDGETERMMILQFCKESELLPGGCRILAETILIYYDKIAFDKKVSHSDLLAFADAIQYLCIWFERETAYIEEGIDPYELLMMVETPTFMSAANHQPNAGERASAFSRQRENMMMRTDEILECLKESNGRLAYAVSRFTDSDSYKLIESIDKFKGINQLDMEEEEGCQEFVKSVIRTLPEQKVSSVVKEQQERIIQYMGEDAWSKLRPTSKELLVSARITFQEQAKLGNCVTYASFCNSMGNIFEIEMRYRLFEKFIEYQKRKYGDGYRKYHTAVLYKYRAILDVKNFALGTVPFILGVKNDRHDRENRIEQNKAVILEYAKDELFLRRYSDTDYREKFRELSDISEHIRCTYRNPTAHVEQTITLEKAVQCMDYFLREECILRKVLEWFAF